LGLLERSTSLHRVVGDDQMKSRAGLHEHREEVFGGFFWPNKALGGEPSARRGMDNYSQRRRRKERECPITGRGGGWSMKGKLLGGLDIEEGKTEGNIFHLAR